MTHQKVIKVKIKSNTRPHIFQQRVWDNVKHALKEEKFKWQCVFFQGHIQTTENKQ